MANEEQLAILRQGVQIWNEWRIENQSAKIDLREASLSGTQLRKANLLGADLKGAHLRGTNLNGADLRESTLYGAILNEADLRGAECKESNFSNAFMIDTILANLDLSEALGLEEVVHLGPSRLSTDTLARSKGKIPKGFLKGCGLSDWEIELSKLYNPGLSNHEIDEMLYKVHDLRASQSLQISPLFISYSHGDGLFVDKLENHLNTKGIRFWRDVYDMRSGRIETQIDRAIRQNPTVLLILSEHSLKSDWVEHEVHSARELEKETGRDVLCPVALDDSWKNSPWPKRIMEHVMEYNILDFSNWNDDSKFGSTFNKLIDGLELFYKE